MNVKFMGMYLYSNFSELKCDATAQLLTIIIVIDEWYPILHQSAYQTEQGNL
jgi:hypothetical protein